ncbi:hypothetical protein J6590_078072 [Homalodisca vitripennis]|nr:hypothetical protein J6590_078072 [Homalodisca vitripennis]
MCRVAGFAEIGEQISGLLSDMLPTNDVAVWHTMCRVSRLRWDRQTRTTNLLIGSTWSNVNNLNINIDNLSLGGRSKTTGHAPSMNQMAGTPTSPLRTPAPGFPAVRPVAQGRLPAPCRQVLAQCMEPITGDRSPLTINKQFLDKYTNYLPAVFQVYNSLRYQEWLAQGRLPALCRQVLAQCMEPITGDRPPLTINQQFLDKYTNYLPAVFQGLLLYVLPQSKYIIV